MVTVGKKWLAFFATARYVIDMTAEVEKVYDFTSVEVHKFFITNSASSKTLFCMQFFQYARTSLRGFISCRCSDRLSFSLVASGVVYRIDCSITRCLLWDMQNR